MWESKNGKKDLFLKVCIIWNKSSDKARPTIPKISAKKQKYSPCWAVTA